MASLIGAWTLYGYVVIMSIVMGTIDLYFPSENIARAKICLEGTEYNLISNNCEHFAIWCKTRLHESHQVDAVIDFIETIEDSIEKVV